MSLVLKKEEKVESVISSFDGNYLVEDFIKKFIEKYPTDWKKINSEYIKQHKEGKKSPMPIPDQYVKNMLNVYLKKQKKLPKIGDEDQ